MKKIVKRNGTIESFEKTKVINAVYRSTISSQGGSDKGLSELIAHIIETMVYSRKEKVSSKEIHSEIVLLLIDAERRDVAQEYLLYKRRIKNRKGGDEKVSKWEMDELQTSIWEKKYQFEGESFDEWIERVSGGNKDVAKLIRERKFLFAGRILANRGTNKAGRKVTYSNCYVLQPPQDNLESIFETAKKLARTFSYGGGVGIDISNLRPTNAIVHNSAKTTTGAVSFMDLYSMTTGLIGQRGRRGALMISMDINHPDIEEFIDIKTDLNRVTKANISVRVTDEFMNAVKNREQFICSFKVDETGEVIEKKVDAYELFMKLVKNNWDFAEPGILFWDNIEQNNLMSADENFKYAGVNPCAEEPLPAGGSCLLGSINLSEFVDNPFTSSAKFNGNEFLKAVAICVEGLNEVLDEGLPIHPLKEQRDSVGEYRQIGLGVMGIADMLIKLGIRYGSKEAIAICEKISNSMLNAAVLKSALIAKEKGAYSKYDKDNIMNSRFFKENITDEVKNVVEKYGLRNSQLLTIPPTGTISTMLGISGGIEPIFNLSYVRKTESLHDQDVYYKVYTPVVKEYMELNKIECESELPDFFVTAMTLDPEERIKMQSAWQKNIDASISSTINLPNDATVEDVYNIYVSAWESKLKGVTVYRDGCKRSGILLNEKPKENSKDNLQEEGLNEEEVEKFICPECGNEEVNQTGGCGVCLQCGYSKCG